MADISLSRAKEILHAYGLIHLVKAHKSVSDPNLKRSLEKISDLLTLGQVEVRNYLDKKLNARKKCLCNRCSHV